MRIYEFLLDGARIDLRNRGSKPKAPTHSAWAYIHIHSLIRQEIFPLFYSSTAFHFLDGFTLSNLHDFCSTVGPDAVARLRDVHFNTKGRCTMYGLQPDTDFCQRYLRPLHPSSTPESIEPQLSVGIPRTWSNWANDLCSNGVMRCTGWTAQGVRAAYEAIPWREGAAGVQEPAVSREILMKLWRALESDNGCPEEEEVEFYQVC